MNAVCVCGGGGEASVMPVSRGLWELKGLFFPHACIKGEMARHAT